MSDDKWFWSKTLECPKLMSSQLRPLELVSSFQNTVVWIFVWGSYNFSQSLSLSRHEFLATHSILSTRDRIITSLECRVLWLLDNWETVFNERGSNIASVFVVTCMDFINTDSFFETSNSTADFEYIYMLHAAKSKTDCLSLGGHVWRNFMR